MQTDPLFVDRQASRSRSDSRANGVLYGQMNIKNDINPNAMVRGKTI